MNPFRVLIIDPDPKSSAFISHEFRKANLDTFVSASGKEGLILAYQNRPHVIIIDPVSTLDTPLKGLLEKLRKDWRLTRAKIIAFSSLRSPSEIQSALELNFDEYIPKESHALAKLTDIVKAAAQTARTATVASPGDEQTSAKEFNEPSHLKREGKTIIFLSSKGGVGTTSLCLNIAHIAGIKPETNIAVVDLVLPIGSMEPIVGTHDSSTIVKASNATGESALTDFLQKSIVKPPNWNFKFLAGSRNPDESDQVDITKIPLIIESLKQISDVVYVDIGKTLSRITLPIITSADLIVLTLSLDKTTVEQTRSVWQFLQKKGVREDQIYFLINRAVSLDGLTKSEVETILGATIQLAIPHMGRNFTLSNNLNQPITDKFPQDAVTISLRQANDEMIRKIQTRTEDPTFF